MFKASVQYDNSDLLNYSMLFYKTGARKVRILFLAFAVVFSVLELMLLFNVFSYGNPDGMMIALLVLIPVLIAELVMMPRIQARRTAKTFQKIGVDDFTIDDEGIMSRNQIAQSQYSYSSIENAYRYKETYYLFINKQQAIVLPERCFTQGDPDAFGAFISEKTGLELKEIN